jgi:hypothetical protein
VLNKAIAAELTSISRATTALGRLVVDAGDDLDVYALSAALLQLSAVRQGLEALHDQLHDRVHGADLGAEEGRLTT